MRKSTVQMFPLYLSNQLMLGILLDLPSDHLQLARLTSIYNRLCLPFYPLAYNAFYTANSGLSRTLPPSFLTKEKQILALIFMKQIEK
ncbi:hypothetical protein BS624_21715 [Vibrio parahaemolyticus]|nr:hypothetical protein BS624_21715 [Vibrio parahaemolyticus]